MKKFFIIGLGNFGLNIALTLVENDCEVLGMDSNREVVQRARDFISHAIIGDASNKEVLESLALRDFDGAVISIGQDMGASILIALYIKEIGIPRVIVRAISEDHGKILKLIGVTDVIFPERDMAIRVANKLALKNAIDYLPITDDYGIIEVTPPKSFIGKSLKDLQISTRFGCQVIGLKLPPEGGTAADIGEKGHTIRIAPSAHDIIPENAVMIVIGKHRDIERLQGSR
ncbi:MAG TPA: TrkA family potassium uptake protein [Spirochaetota bacterium]|jgi:trk system potassium uptake protein TrkA|nr:TrkA family potassium uptake protein [Spirochaetota bacterium]OPZ35521.1 MAG: Ktr system potassium uptake protein A [Spirochaetes bacterium ADurb.BinA120]HNU93058.1 TrkA family potassium uptake protein [Spirochaetota bacterium]HPI15929.1 TrkA family potassium uptake protein [Spirochaetota bacterium]HPV97073.1 TrkA family potassium uptake protein [Spirochaetota bacterium]